MIYGVIEHEKEHGFVGLAVFDEARKIKKAIFQPKNGDLHFCFSNGDTDTLVTRLEPLFQTAP